jgi:hypothetical protein
MQRPWVWLSDVFCFYVLLHDKQPTAREGDKPAADDSSPAACCADPAASEMHSPLQCHWVSAQAHGVEACAISIDE